LNSTLRKTQIEANIWMHLLLPWFHIIYITNYDVFQWIWIIIILIFDIAMVYNNSPTLAQSLESLPTHQWLTPKKGIAIYLQIVLINYSFVFPINGRKNRMNSLASKVLIILSYVFIIQMKRIFLLKKFDSNYNFRESIEVWSIFSLLVYRVRAE